MSQSLFNSLIISTNEAGFDKLDLEEKLKDSILGNLLIKLSIIGIQAFCCTKEANPLAEIPNRKPEAMETS